MGALGESALRSHPSPAARYIPDEGEEDAEAVARRCGADVAEKDQGDGSEQEDGFRSGKTGHNESGRADTHAEDAIKAAVDAIPMDADEGQKERARRTRAEIAKAATEKLQEVIHGMGAAEAGLHKVTADLQLAGEREARV